MMENEKKILIDYKDVSINQQEQPIFKDINLRIFEKDFVFLSGRIGSGKSTLLKSFYYEVPILSGKAQVLEYNLKNMKRRRIPHLRRNLGIVFQDFKLLIDRNINENLRFVLRATGKRTKAEISNRVTEVLKYVGMTNKGYKMPHELSGGEQQRIVIARALLNDPQILLADEPTGNLDFETGNELIQLLHKISQEGTAVIIATHNQRWAEMYPGRNVKCENCNLIEEQNESNRSDKQQ